MAKTYGTRDVLRRVGICHNTLYNWFTLNKIKEVRKDRNKRRIYTEADIEHIKAFKNSTLSPIRSEQI